MAKSANSPNKSASTASTSSGGDGSDASRRVTTIERATDVLFLFASDRPSLGVTEIASELGISKAVVHRILTSLQARDLVSSNPSTRKYSLGPAVLELAATYRDQLNVRPFAIEAMQRLSDKTGETATLSIRTGWRRSYVEQVTPTSEVKMTVTLGVQYPLHAGSSSKAFLAFLTPSEQEAYIKGSDLEAVTESTITDADTLRRSLAEIRKRGYAISLGERQTGAGSVAAPIMDGSMPVAVISVCGPLERFKPIAAKAAELVVEETRSISALLHPV